jgi:hypothetical protein
MTQNERIELLNSLIERNRARGLEPTAMPDDDRSNLVAFAFQVGDPVFMKYDPDPTPGVVTVLEVHTSHVLYRVMWCDIRSETAHYDFELAKWREKSARRVK